MLICMTFLVSKAGGSDHEDPVESKQRQNNSNDDKFAKSPITDTLFTVLEVFMIVLLLVLVFLYIVRLLYKDDLNKVKTPCYLCLNHYDKMEQKHRDKCAGVNKEELDLMPSPRNVCCCFCSEKLKLWPIYKMTPFKCNSGFEKCPLKNKRLRCDGTNRFSCFLCDYTLCLGCVNIIDPVVKHGPADIDKTSQVELEEGLYSESLVNYVNVYNSPWNTFTSDYANLV